MIMLGIDVSKTKIDCCIFPQGLTGKRKNKIFTNTESGFSSLLKWLITLKIEPDQVTAIMEATSVYHENLGYYLYDAGVKVCVANPSRVRAFAKGWTAPSILDTRRPHFEAASKASGLIPSRCE